jgi:hypothetical protein
VRKNTLLHTCGEDGGGYRDCGCTLRITAEEAARMVADGRARYRFRPGAPGKLKIDMRAIVVTMEVPRILRGRTVSARDIERAYVEGRRHDSERIECFAAGSLRDRIQFCEEV